MAGAEAPAVGAVPGGGSSRATSKETTMAIAGTTLRPPENLGELLWVVRRVFGNSAGALDKGLGTCVKILLIRRKGSSDGGMCCPEPTSLLDRDDLTYPSGKLSTPLRKQIRAQNTFGCKSKH